MRESGGTKHVFNSFIKISKIHKGSTKYYLLHIYYNVMQPCDVIVGRTINANTSELFLTHIVVQYAE